MQDIKSKKKSKEGFNINVLPLEDKQRLVGAFVWLIEEDKRQNPAYYNKKQDD